jgi:hypothetical protein
MTTEEYDLNPFESRQSPSAPAAVLKSRQRRRYRIP